MIGSKAHELRISQEEVLSALAYFGLSGHLICRPDREPGSESCLHSRLSSMYIVTRTVRRPITLAIRKEDIVVYTVRIYLLNKADIR